MASYKTRAGVNPSEQELPFSITTSMVEEYLQKKLNVVVNGMRKNNQYDGGDIELKVVTTDMGTKFVPFVVVLPMSVLKNRKKQQNNNNELSIFNPKESDGTATLLDPISKMLASYTFDKADGEAFFSADWRRARGVSTTVSAVLKRNRVPQITRMNNGNMSTVTLLIDPIRVFHDMLVMPEQNANFDVFIEKWQKIRSGEYRYDIIRSVKRNRKNKGGNSFADELNRKMRGFNR